MLTWIIFFFIFISLLITVLLIILKDSRTEVKPATALVYNNMWTGRTNVILPGTGFIVPGIHRILEKEVSLKNEAENPSNVNLVTADGIELEVDYIVRRLQVGYPGMNNTIDHDRLKACIVRVATTINYPKRRDLVLTRMISKLQEIIEIKNINELFPEVNIGKGKLEKGELGKVDKKKMHEIEAYVNNALVNDIVTTEWGFWVEIDLEDYNLPLVIRKAREERSSAEIAGKALKDKAKAAGVKNPEWFIIADALSGIFGKKGG